MNPVLPLAHSLTSPPPLAVMIRTEPLLPDVIVGPVAVVTLIALALHLAGLRRAAMPESRRRIRMANAVLMMVATGLLAGALGYVTMSEVSAFVLSWTAAAAVLVMIGTLAVADVFNTWRLHRSETRDLRRNIRRLRGELATLIAEHRRAEAGRERAPDRAS